MYLPSTLPDTVATVCTGMESRDNYRGYTLGDFKHCDKQHPARAIFFQLHNNLYRITKDRSVRLQLLAFLLGREIETSDDVKVYEARALNRLFLQRDFKEAVGASYGEHNAQ